MEDAVIEHHEERATEHHLTIRLKRKTCSCPICATQTSMVHDYRTRRVIDIPVRDKKMVIHYRRRRYLCLRCHKRFAEPCGFIGKYQRFTSRVALSVMERLQMRLSMKDIALQTGTSVSDVLRCLGLQPQTPPRWLPSVLALDEFKGNAGNEKFQCILTAPQQGQVFDILPSRNVSTLQAYLKSYPNRGDVNVVVMDMNRGFRDVARAFYPMRKS